MAQLIGTWKHESSENMEPFLTAIEYMPADKLKVLLGESDTWANTIKQDGDKWTIDMTAATSSTHSMCFKSGEEFIETELNGDVKTVVNVEGDNKMSQKHFTEKGDISTVREIGPDGKLHITLEAGGMKASSIYVRS